MAVRLSWCFLPAILLAGCSPPDYGAVRDWAGSAASATVWHAAPARPAAAETPPAARAEAIRAMQAALDAWFTALSVIAADGLVRQPKDPLEADAAKAAAVDAEAGRAVGTIGGLLVTATKGNWRAPQTAGAIRAADPAVQVLLRSLSIPARHGGGDAADRAAIAALYAPLEAATRDLAARQAFAIGAHNGKPNWMPVSPPVRRISMFSPGSARARRCCSDRASHLSQAETARQLRAAEERCGAPQRCCRGARDPGMSSAPRIASPRSRANEVVSRHFRAHGAIVNPSGSARFVSSCLSAEPGFRPALADWPAPRRAWGGTHA